MREVVLVTSSLQKSRPGNNNCDPEGSSRLEDIQGIADLFYTPELGLVRRPLVHDPQKP